jgi:DNA polymerase-3 subunit epsilon
LALCGLPALQPFACTVLLSRRLYPEAPSHKLGQLVDWFGLPRTGKAHRALADAEMATELLGRIRHDLMLKHGVARPDHAFLCALQACSKAALPKFFARQASVALA